MTQHARQVRPLSLDDDLDALLDLECRSFGHFPTSERECWRAAKLAAIRDGGLLAVFDGARVAAAAQILDMVQWWQGCPVAMAGVAGVMVAPEDRGKGVGRSLMAAVLAEIAARGYPLSVLHPATMALYRPLGWEIAGTADVVSVHARSLRSLAQPDPSLAGLSLQPREPADLAAGVRRAGPDDAAAVIEVIGGVHRIAADCGPVTRDEATMRQFLGMENRYSYLAAGGFLSYQWDDRGHEIMVHQMAAASAAATRALWSVVASHCTIARTVRARIGPVDPLWWLMQEQDLMIADRSLWMLRVVDAAKAVGARGFPTSVNAQVAVQLEDTLRPGNAGCWHLDVSGGRGRLTRCPEHTGPAPVTLGARGFAAMFAGTPLASLRRAGLATGGDPDADAVLNAAFAATAFLLDYF